MFSSVQVTFFRENKKWVPVDIESVYLSRQTQLKHRFSMTHIAEVLEKSTFVQSFHAKYEKLAYLK